MVYRLRSLPGGGADARKGLADPRKVALERDLPSAQLHDDACMPQAKQKGSLARSTVRDAAPCLLTKGWTCKGIDLSKQPQSSCGPTDKGLSPLEPVRETVPSPLRPTLTPAAYRI